MSGAPERAAPHAARLALAEAVRAHANMHHYNPRVWVNAVTDAVRVYLVTPYRPLERSKFYPGTYKVIEAPWSRPRKPLGDIEVHDNELRLKLEESATDMDRELLQRMVQDVLAGRTGR